MSKLPLTYQEVAAYMQAQGDELNPTPLRIHTIQQIANLLGRPLVCYIARTTEPIPFLPPEAVNALPNYIDENDLYDLRDILCHIQDTALDILIISNGGIPEAAERIVSLLRSRFQHLRWIVPANAYSAATLLCLSGDAIIMTDTGTLGPVDPQLEGIPAYTILNGFREMLDYITQNGGDAAQAYAPLLERYPLELIKFCEAATELSKELARKWLSQYMLQCNENAPEVARCAEYLANFDIHKSHGRSIPRETARQIGLKVVYAEEIDQLSELLQSLTNQYRWLFNTILAMKIFENSLGETAGTIVQPPDLNPAVHLP